MFNAAVNAEDRARGWAEVELPLKDGSRQIVRVHSVGLADLLHASGLNRVAAHRYLMAQALRSEPADFIERIAPTGEVSLAVAIAALGTDNQTADQMADAAAAKALSDHARSAGKEFCG